MERNRGLKGAIALVAAFGLFFAVWLLLGGPGEISGETPGRLSGQTVQPTESDRSTDQPASSSSSTSTAPDTSPSTDPASGLPWVALSALPAEVGTTLDAIEAGPPYPYRRDGVTFGNREGLLPDEEYGYYQEFTVPTPGSSDRGARRVIWGLGDELYYTPDHYASFARIQP